jgi:trehalose-6-phosphate synthase
MRFDKPKHQRLHKRFVWVEVEGMWWDLRGKTWIETVRSDMDYSSGRYCRSLRAFRRMLRKHPHIKGKATLVSRYVGYNVYA